MNALANSVLFIFVQATTSAQITGTVPEILGAVRT
jgi:hypothetical protein